jgi:hypothetical protein
MGAAYLVALLISLAGASRCSSGATAGVRR